MYLESDPRLPAPSHPAAMRHHISPPGSLSRLSPQDSEFSDVDEFGRPGKRQFTYKFFIHTTFRQLFLRTCNYRKAAETAFVQKNLYVKC